MLKEKSMPKTKSVSVSLQNRPMRSFSWQLDTFKLTEALESKSSSNVESLRPLTACHDENQASCRKVSPSSVKAVSLPHSSSSLQLFRSWAVSERTSLFLGQVESTHKLRFEDYDHLGQLTAWTDANMDQLIHTKTSWKLLWRELLDL